MSEFQDISEYQLPQEYQEKVREFKQAQAKITLDGFFGSLPIVGPFWSAYRSGMFEFIVAERFSKFDCELKTLGMSALTPEFFKRDEGFDLITKVLQQVSRTRSEEKIKRFARIVQGVTSGEEIDFEQAETFVDIIAETSDEEMLYLALTYKQYGMKDFWINEESHINTMESRGIMRGRHKYIVKRLESYGLMIVEDMAAAGGFSHECTEVAAEFLDFMEKQ